MKLILITGVAMVAMACYQYQLSEPSVDGLERRAEAYFEAMSHWQFLDMYGFYPAEFRDACTLKEFTDEARTTFETIQKNMKIDDDEFIDFEVIDVRIKGTDGVHGINLLYKGDVVGTFSETEDLIWWTLIDGKWLFADYSDDGCF